MVFFGGDPPSLLVQKTKKVAKSYHTQIHNCVHIT